MKSRTGWVLMTLVLALSLAPAAQPAFGGDPPFDGGTPALVRGQIDYWYVGNLGITDSEGRTLVWEGTIKGDLTGTMKWWFGPSPAPTVRYDGGRVNYYAGRWEIWNEDGDVLLLAGDSAGKTVTPGAPGAWGVGMWDGHGVVTYGRLGGREGQGGYARLKHNRVYETGPVIFNTEAYPNKYSGTGIFTIY